jgi:hypothetical protein
MEAGQHPQLPSPEDSAPTSPPGSIVAATFIRSRCAFLDAAMDEFLRQDAQAGYAVNSAGRVDDSSG